MTDNLRERIANTAGDFLSDNFHAYLEQDVALEMADAVIRELGSDCIYRYACSHCGDFWFNKSERMQRFALLHDKTGCSTND